MRLEDDYWDDEECENWREEEKKRGREEEKKIGRMNRRMNKGMAEWLNDVFWIPDENQLCKNKNS